MGVLTGILFAIGGLILVTLIKISTTFFHEMGHAIPALLFTEKTVTVYIGSYGDISKTSHFKLGRLEIYFKWNLSDWNMGMCTHDGNIKSIRQNALILLGGPFASLLISIPLILSLSKLSNYQIPFFVSVVFIISSLFDLITNLTPMATTFEMHNGRKSYSDGYQLLNLFARSKAPPAFFEIEKKFEEKKYDEVIEMAQTNIEVKPDERFAYDFMIESLVIQKDYEGAIEMFNVLKHNIGLTDEDYFSVGKVYSKNGNYKEALKLFDHYRHKHFSDPNLLNEIAYAELELGENEKVINTTSALLSIDKTYLEAYITRSHALINMREYDYAKADLELIFSATDKNPRANYVYGLLHEKLSEERTALDYFLKSRELGFEHHGLRYKIERIEGELGV